MSYQPLDLMTSEKINERRLKVQGTDYLTEVARGNIPGASLTAVVARNPAIGTSFEDCWGEGGQMVYPTSAETWEIVSDTATDTIAGIGVQTVLIRSLDEDLIEQQQIVDMNGTTPVVLTGTHLRPNGIFAVMAGSSGVNIGTLRLQASGGGNVRNVMLPAVGRSHDTHYTVPAGKSAQFLTTVIVFPKDGAGQFMNSFRFSAAGSAWNTGSVLSMYQNIVPFPFESRPTLPEKSDLRLQVKSGSADIDVSVIFEFLLLDNVIT